MLDAQDARSIMGATAYGSDGDKIGKVGQVYLDDQTGRPEFVTVNTGLFGSNESFVPVSGATFSGDRLEVPFTKDKVKDAPKIDTDGHLSPQEEEELYRYYGMGGSYTGTETTTDTTQTTGMVGTTQTTGTMQTTDTTDTGYAENDHGTVGRDVSGPTTDNAMTRSEEQLQVGTRSEEVGRARLRKFVVTENVTQTVPVTREEVRIEREPITDANIGNALDGPAISEEEHEVTLHAERPVVEKEAVPVERVRLDTQTVTEQQQVSEQVRKEEIEVDGGQTGVAGTGTTGGDDRGFVQKAKDALDRDNDGKIGR